jgi:streptogramin lyase
MLTHRANKNTLAAPADAVRLYVVGPSRAVVTAFLMSILVLASLTMSFCRPDSALGKQGDIDEFPSALAGGAGGAPIDFAVGHDGQIWATETGGEIVRFDPTGQVTGEFSAPIGAGPSQPQTSHPEGITVAASGDVWFTDTGSNAEGHSFIGRVSSSYNVSEFKLPTASVVPMSIAEGSDGNLWFTESDPQQLGLGAIGRITPSGEITEFRVPAGHEMLTVVTSMPSAIISGADGNMWFTDDGRFPFGYRGLVGRVAPDGTITEWPVPTAWGLPGAIAQGADGNIWFTETEGHIVRMTPQGEMAPFPIVTSGGSINSLAEGPDGNLWLAEDERTNTISRVTPAGVLTEFSPVAPRGGYPVAIAFDHEGHLWFGETQASRIWRWTTPRVPANEIPPEVSGDVLEGQMVTVSDGAWIFEPESFLTQWQSCSPAGDYCIDLPGETSSSHFVTHADVGHTLRARITAVGLGGAASTTSATVGPARASLAAPMPGMPQPTGLMPLQRTPSPSVVGAAMTWRFAWSHTYTIVKSLSIHSLLPGDVIEVVCRGHGCPSRPTRVTAATQADCQRHRCPKLGMLTPGGQLSLHPLFNRQRLRVGVHISVTVMRGDWIGKTFTFVVRSARAPRVTVSCMTPSSQAADNSC